jgi:hypothetical protein
MFVSTIYSGLLALQKMSQEVVLTRKPLLVANKLEGSVPTEIGSLELDFLNLRSNTFMGDLDQGFCGREYQSFWADCHGNDALVSCTCCTVCCDEEVCCNDTECCTLDKHETCKPNNDQKKFP